MLILGAACAGFVALSPVVRAGDTIVTVGVVGEARAMDGRYELQIGRDAWKIDRAGYELVETPVALTATVWQVDGCVAAIRFEVAPVPGRSRTTVDLGDGTRTPWIRRTGSDAVPTRSVSMHRAHAPTCALPDTATATSSQIGRAHV